MPTNGEYRWEHIQCELDHGRLFLQVFGEKGLEFDR